MHLMAKAGQSWLKSRRGKAYCKTKSNGKMMDLACLTLIYSPFEICNKNIGFRILRFCFNICMSCVIH